MPCVRPSVSKWVYGIAFPYISHLNASSISIHPPLPCVSRSAHSPRPHSVSRPSKLRHPLSLFLYLRHPYSVIFIPVPPCPFASTLFCFFSLVRLLLPLFRQPLPLVPLHLPSQPSCPSQTTLSAHRPVAPSYSAS